MTQNELKKRLRAIGCEKILEGKRHEIWYSPITDNRFPVGRHGSEDVPKGTLAAIKNQSGLR
ncbi:MAG: type II toxin-antitoxin system HicA family toxin [Ruminococcus sp.]|jgi:predicted RNA binding protein YcfA (HicA-like mRNA interferase family)|nr:type II toxin-antitoxin system HicA family toxin [Ruminococcus sp.]